MKYNKKIVRTICIAIKEHQGRVGACKIAGISFKTFREWIKTKPTFEKVILEAEDENKNDTKTLATQSIISKFSESWQSAAWWLERNFPNEFAKMEKRELSGNKDSPVMIGKAEYDLSELSVEELEILYKLQDKNQ